MRRLHGIGPVAADRFLAPARPEHVEGDPGDDGGQPAAKVLHLTGIRTAQPHPGVLDRVVCVARRAEQPVRHGPQMRAVLLERHGQPVTVAHRSHSLDAGVTTLTPGQRRT
jgi:hypothetical protein